MDTTMDAVNPEGWGHVLARSAAALAQLGGVAWLTGGGVRDALLGRSPRDLDLAITADPWALARLLAPPGAPGAAVVPLRETHGTVRVALPMPGSAGITVQVDLAPLRGGTLLADLGARDFTVNAMAWPLAAYDAFVELLARRSPATARDATALFDPLSGLADLHGGRLRVASETALVDDPVRAVRGARLAAALDLTPDAATLAQMRAASPALAGEPVERVSDELRGILAPRESTRAARGLALLHEAGALDMMLSELAAPPADLNAGSASGASLARAIQTVAALDAARDAIAARAPAARQTDLRAWLDGWESRPLTAGRPRMLALRWAALLHPLAFDADTGSQATVVRALGPGVFKRMGLAKPERDLVRTVARMLSLPSQLMNNADYDPLDRRPVRRFFAATGEAGVETLLMAVAHALADPSTSASVWAHGAAPAEAIAILAADWIARFAWARATVLPPPLVDGSALIAVLHIPPGPEVGRLLVAIRQAQVEGAIEDASQALALARRLLDG